MPRVRFVYLLRHAKSSWKSGVPDHERPLATRGRRASKAICRHLREQGVEPELMLCSTARRARETLERIEPLGSPAVRLEPGLYGAGSDAQLDRLTKMVKAGELPKAERACWSASIWGASRALREPV
jgi:phosphohistidine phosphatase